jgi:transposase
MLARSVIPTAPEPDSRGDSQNTLDVSPCGCRRFAWVNGMASVKITRQDLDATQLRAEAGRTADAKQARRRLAIAMVVDGHSRLLAARAGGMDRQALRDWVHRYNAEGLAGLVDRLRPGPQPRMTDAQMSDLAKWVEDGPDLGKDGVVRWRRCDLRDRIANKFAVTLHERSVGKLLHKLNFSSISVRPLHPQSDLAGQETFKKTSPNGHAPRSRRSMLANRSKSGSKMRPALASKAR